MNQKIAVIGAGIAGLASAIRLACAGYSVEVFEANATVGGKIAEYRSDGFRFDMGASLFTLPVLIEELFTLANRNIADYLPYQKLDLVTKYFFPDQTVINGYAEVDRLAEELYEKIGFPKAKTLDYFRSCAEKYDLIGNIFLNNSLHESGTWFSQAAFRAYAQIWKLDAFRTMHQAHQSFFKEPHLVQLFDRFATYNGSSPYLAPATLSIIPHLEHNIGAYFPKEGMFGIVKSLHRLAKELGVRFHVESPVQEILVEKKGKRAKISGIRTKNEILSFDKVVSNADMVSTYRKLLPLEKAPEMMLEQPKSSSGLIFYWNIEGIFPQLELHNILFSENYEAEFEHIFKHKTISPDPTVYIFISQKICPKDAPVACENWFVMINTPHNEGQNWDEWIEKARKSVISKINKMLNIEVEKHIRGEYFLDARGIEARTGSAHGALYGNSSNNRFAAFLRHPNFSKEIENLYFCGGSVHPGGGIPLCVLSAKLVAKKIGKNAK